MGTSDLVRTFAGGCGRLQTVAGSCERLLTVASSCERLRNVERTHPQPPDPQSETGTLATHSGKSLSQKDVPHEFSVNKLPLGNHTLWCHQTWLENLQLFHDFPSELNLHGEFGGCSIISQNINIKKMGPGPIFTDIYIYKVYIYIYMCVNIVHHNNFSPSPNKKSIPCYTTKKIGMIWGTGYLP